MGRKGLPRLPKEDPGRRAVCARVGSGGDWWGRAARRALQGAGWGRSRRSLREASGRLQAEPSLLLPSLGRSPGGQRSPAGEAGAGAAGHTPGPNFLPRRLWGQWRSSLWEGCLRGAPGAARGPRSHPLPGAEPPRHLCSTRADRGPHPVGERTRERRLARRDVGTPSVPERPWDPECHVGWRVSLGVWNSGPAS